MKSFHFHSEIKSELDLERLPSSKFANDLVLHFGIFAYNLLRIIGQESLQVDDQPLRKKRSKTTNSHSDQINDHDGSQNGFPCWQMGTENDKDPIVFTISLRPSKTPS